MKNLDFTVAVMLQVEASDLFGDDNINWKFCNEHAAFAHKNACEFILTTDDSPVRIATMREYGCTTEFIDAFFDAVCTGASWVMFYC